MFGRLTAYATAMPPNQLTPSMNFRNGRKDRLLDGCTAARTAGSFEWPSCCGRPFCGSSSGSGTGMAPLGPGLAGNGQPWTSIASCSVPPSRPRLETTWGRPARRLMVASCQRARTRSARQGCQNRRRMQSRRRGCPLPPPQSSHVLSGQNNRSHLERRGRMLAGISRRPTGRSRVVAGARGILFMARGANMRSSEAIRRNRQGRANVNARMRNKQRLKRSPCGFRVGSDMCDRARNFTLLHACPRARTARWTAWLSKMREGGKW